MIESIKRVTRIVLVFLLILFIFGIVYVFCFFKDKNQNEETYLESLQSHDGKYTLKSYLIDGGSITGDSVRVELIDNYTGDKKNIYSNYPEREVIMYWIDKDTVNINGIELDIDKEIYDWRKER